MSTPLTVNGVTFNYPQNFDTNWGIDATGWAQAVTSGMLQKAGGSFPLAADVNFGASFGIISPYFTSHAANPATSGTIRLASADPGIAFRDNINSTNFVLTTNASNNLIYPRGLELSGTLILHTGTAIAFRDNADIQAIDMFAPAVTTNYSFVLPPNAGSSGQVLQTDGTGVTTWVNASGTGTVNTGTAGNFTYYATSTNAVSDSGISSTAPTFSGLVTGNTFRSTALSNQLSFTNAGGGNQIRTINIAATTTVGEVITVPDSGSSDTVALLGATQTFTAPTTLNSGVLGGNLNANSNKITSLAAPTTTGDALRYGSGFSVGSAKITSLANGTVSTDAAAFGQIFTGFQAAVQNTTQSVSTNGSSTFTDTLLTASITPTSSSHRIKITVAGSLTNSNVAGTNVYCTIGRGATNFGGTSGIAQLSAPSSTGAFMSPIAITYIDSPATTSSVTYVFRTRAVGGGNAIFPVDANSTAVMILEEIV